MRAIAVAVPAELEAIGLHVDVGLHRAQREHAGDEEDRGAHEPQRGEPCFRRYSKINFRVMATGSKHGAICRR